MTFFFILTFITYSYIYDILFILKPYQIHLSEVRLYMTFFFILKPYSFGENVLVLQSKNPV